MTLQDILKEKGPAGWTLETVKASIAEGFDSEMAKAIGFSKESCADSKDFMTAKIVFTYFKDGEVQSAMIVVMDMPEPGKRYEYFFAMGMKTAEDIKAVAPCYAFMMSEMHYVVQKEGQDRDDFSKFLKDDPSAKECLAVTGLACTGKRRIWRSDISRDVEGTVVFGAEDVKDDGHFNLLEEFFKGYATVVMRTSRP